MAVDSTDDFTGAVDFDVLADRTASDGTTYAHVTGQTTNIRFYNQRAYPLDFNADHLLSKVPAYANQTVTVNYNLIAAENGFDGAWIGVKLRSSTDGTTGVRFIRYNGTWRIDKYISGTLTVVDVDGTAIAATGDHTVVYSIIDDVASIVIDGTTVASGTVSDITDKGRYIISAGGTMSAVGGMHIEAITFESEDDVAPDPLDTVAICTAIDAGTVYAPKGSWDRADDDTSVQAVNMGAYIKTRITDVTTLKVGIDVALQDAAGIVTGSRHRIGWEITEATNATRVRGIATTSESQTVQTITTALNASLTYDVKIYMASMLYTEERWNGGYDVDYGLRLTNLQFTENGTLLAPTVHARKVWQFGDSTTLDYHATGNEGHIDTDAVYGWVMRSAEALEEEVDNLGVGATGWDKSFTSGPMTIPPVITPGNAALSYWWQYTLGRTRDFSDVDEIRINLGRNDEHVGSATSDETITTNMTAWLADVRTRAGAAVLVTFQIPFGGANRSIITSTAATLAASDVNVRLIDYGAPAEIGLNAAAAGGAARVYSIDGGVHPDDEGHQRLALLHTAAIEAANAVTNTSIGY